MSTAYLMYCDKMFERTNKDMFARNIYKQALLERMEAHDKLVDAECYSLRVLDNYSKVHRNTFSITPVRTGAIIKNSKQFKINF